jgi:hypothetical protein
MQAYMEFGKIQEDFDTLRTVLEIFDGRPLAPKTKIDFLHNKINKAIQADPKLLLSIMSDKLLPNRVLIKRSIERGLISNRGGYLYYTKDNSPLCGPNQDPTVSVAADFLNHPVNQSIKFALEAALKDK